MPRNNPTEKESTEELDEYHKLEMSQVFARIQSLEDFRVQIGIFFGTANLTALGVALSVQKAGILFVAAAILILFMVIDMRQRVTLAIFNYRGLQLQKRYAPQDMETFLRILPRGLISKVREISQLEDFEGRLAALTKISVSAPSFFGFWIPFVVTVLEIIAGFLLWLTFGWSLF